MGWMIPLPGTTKVLARPSETPELIANCVTGNMVMIMSKINLEGGDINPNIQFIEYDFDKHIFVLRSIANPGLMPAAEGEKSQSRQMLKISGNISSISDKLTHILVKDNILYEVGDKYDTMTEDEYNELVVNNESVIDGATVIVMGEVNLFELPKFITTFKEIIPVKFSEVNFNLILESLEKELYWNCSMKCDSNNIDINIVNVFDDKKANLHLNLLDPKCQKQIASTLKDFYGYEKYIFGYSSLTDAKFDDSGNVEFKIERG